MNERDEQRRTHASGGESRSEHPRPPTGQYASEPYPGQIGARYVAARKERHDPDPRPAPTSRQVAGEQNSKEGGHILGVKILRDRPPNPRVGREEHQADACQRGGFDARPAASGYFTQPSESDRLRPHDREILHPEQGNAMWPDPVHQRQRPHHELGVDSPERDSHRATKRVQVTVRDQEPWLVVEREVLGKREVAVQERAPEKESGQLDAQQDKTDTSHPVQRRECWRRPVLSGGRGRGGHAPHARNLTARMGEYPYGKKDVGLTRLASK